MLFSVPDGQQTRLFPVPHGFPPPVSEGDELDRNTTVGPLCDTFVLGNKRVYRFFVTVKPKAAKPSRVREPQMLPA